MKQIFVLMACFLFISKSAMAVDPGLNWKTIESEHLYVHYADGNKYIAERALAITEAAHLRLTKELNWTPREKTHVILSDESDQPNGFATPIFFNRTVIFLAPPTSVNTLEDFDDWLGTIIFHEYTHIVHLDKSTGAPGFLKNIFGRFFLLFPNLFQPSWVVEGLATYKETYTERGVGRGQSAMFASMMREEVANGLKPVSHVNLPVSTWPAGNTRYLYGVYFMKFIEETYGEDKLHEWIEEYSDNLAPFFINRNANQTLGKTLTPLWQEFQQWLKDRFQPQIDAIKAGGIKAGTQISSDAYRTDSVRVVAKENGDEIFYVSNSGYKRASLVHVNTDGKTEELFDLNGGAGLDIHPQAGLLLTQDEYCNNYTIYKDIYRYDEENKELKRLTECGRYIFASWFPDGKQIVAVHHEAGQLALHLLDKEAQLEEVLWRPADKEVIGQIDVSSDGKNVVASVWRKGDGWNIELFNIKNKNWKKLTTGVSIKVNPQFTAQGNILFSMEANGVYNLYRYYAGSEKVEQLTNLVGGAFQSSQAKENGAIYYSGYTAEGYAIYKLKADKLEGVSAFAQAPVFKSDSLENIYYDVTDHQQQDYSALSNMYPRWWFPVLGFTEQRSEIGITTSGADALNIHQYSITASYDTKLDAPAGTIAYAFADRFFVSAQRLNELSLDANGDVSRLSNRSLAAAVLAFPNYYLQRQYNLLFSAVFDKTEDGELEAGVDPLNDYEDHLLGIAGLYNSTDFNPLSISVNDGMNLRLVAEDSDILDSDFTGQVYTLDWRQYIRTGRESLLAFRFVQGWGTDKPRNFKLGGEGLSDNAVDIVFGNSSQPVFDVRDYALRGYKEGQQELRGRRMQLLSGEWRFPIERIEKGFMAPPLGIMQWFGNVFAEVGSTYQDSPDDYYSSAGIELTADINIFYNLVLRTRAGYAHGFDSDIGDDRVYLKIGSSF